MNQFNLENTVFKISNGNSWTIADACQGVQIWGATGSGKTSGPARYIAMKYLRLGFGGLVLTCKADEIEAWKRYTKEAGRSDDLIIVEPKGGYYFNFLEYVSNHGDPDKTITSNIVTVLKTVIQSNTEKEGTVSNDPFWEKSLTLILSNLITLCVLAEGKVTIPLLHKLSKDLPQKNRPDSEKISEFDKVIDAARERVKLAIQTWKKTLTVTELHQYKDNEELFNEKSKEHVEEARQYDMVGDFFYEFLWRISEKTRSIIDYNLLGFLSPLLEQPMYELFCKHPSNITPEDCYKGKIIVMGIPVKRFETVGCDLQIMTKFIFQQAWEKRPVGNNDRPLFLFADECQEFLHKSDARFQATARSSKVSTVYITQNLPSYYVNLNSERAEYEVKNLLGNLGTKIFCANSDSLTNSYASEMIGDDDFIQYGSSHSFSKDFSQTVNESPFRKRVIPPEHFISLKTGGQRNLFKVESIIHVQGDPLFGDKPPFRNYSKMIFDQKNKY